MYLRAFFDVLFSVITKHGTMDIHRAGNHLSNPGGLSSKRRRETAEVPRETWQASTCSGWQLWEVNSPAVDRGSNVEALKPEVP
jgi:hypothetical protein